MLIGLPCGKKLLEPKIFSNGELPETRDPRWVYFISSIASSLCILLASFICMTNFWMYALFVGLLSGFFSGLAYQAPMVACQLFFPDWKVGLNGWLMVGLACGIATYSMITAFGATRHCDDAAEVCVPDLASTLRQFSYYMLGHSVLASLLLTRPVDHLNAEDMSQLQSNLLNL